MSDIVTLTMNPTIDTSSSTEHVMAEQKLRCRPPSNDPGGGGINVSRAIKKLGGESRTLYPVGGWYGEKLKELLDREGLDHVPISIHDSTRQDIIIMDKGTDQQYRFQMPGPKLNTTEMDKCLRALEAISPKPRFVVASGSLPPGVPADFYVRVGEIAKKMNAQYIVDTSGEPLLHVARSGAYLLKPNLRELQMLAEQDIENETQIEEAAMSILKNGKVEVLIISLGAGGALLVTRDGYDHMRAPTVPIQSKVGAGDSMVGGLVLRLAQGEPLHEAAMFGVAAGAAAVMSRGTALCRRKDAERLYKRMLSGKYV